VVAVDMNEDHLAAWRLDVHRNPVGPPRRLCYDLSGTAAHRDAQVRHALTRLLHYARRCGAAAIAIEDLDFTDGTSRERHGRNKRFRRLLARFPTTRLKARLVSGDGRHRPHTTGAIVRGIGPSRPDRRPAGDTPLAGELPLPLTTVRSPMPEMGRRGLRLLVRLLVRLLDAPGTGRPHLQRAEAVAPAASV
jgi:DNA-binding LacI/PurR family transcriptional regulator